MEIGIISVVINLLLVTAFIVDRLFRLKSIKEYRAARDAEVTTLKEKIAFIEKYNDSFVSEKYKTAVEELKILINLKEADIELNKSQLNELKSLHAHSEKEKEDFKYENEKISSQRVLLEQSNVALEKEKAVLQEQIFKISAYLSHEIRSPVVTAVGLLNLYKIGEVEENEFVDLLSKTIEKIETVIVKNINDLSNTTPTK